MARVTPMPTPIRAEELATLGFLGLAVEVGDTGTTFPFASVVDAMAPVPVEEPFPFPVNRPFAAFTTPPIEVAASLDASAASPGRLGPPW
jgi:hypothetical protein